MVGHHEEDTSSEGRAGTLLVIEVIVGRDVLHIPLGKKVEARDTSCSVEEIRNRANRFKYNYLLRNLSSSRSPECDRSLLEISPQCFELWPDPLALARLSRKVE